MNVRKSHAHERLKHAPGGTPRSVLAAELDLAHDLGGNARGDRPRRDVAGDDGVRADHRAVADLDPAGDHAVDPEPAVGADPHRARAKRIPAT